MDYRRTSVLSDDTSDDGQETDRDTTTKKPTSKISPEVLPCIKGVSEQIRGANNRTSWLIQPNTQRQLLVRPKWD